MDSNVNKILQNIVNTATLAADEAKAAVHSAVCPVSKKIRFLGTLCLDYWHCLMIRHLFSAIRVMP